MCVICGWWLEMEAANSPVAVRAELHAVVDVAAGVEVDVVDAGVSNGAARDRVGLGWRPEIAAGIFDSLEHIDVIEVIADDYFDASRRHVNALRTLAAQRPLL